MDSINLAIRWIIGQTGFCGRFWALPALQDKHHVRTKPDPVAGEQLHRAKQALAVAESAFFSPHIFQFHLAAVEHHLRMARGNPRRFDADLHIRSRAYHQSVSHQIELLPFLRAFLNLHPKSFT